MLSRSEMRGARALANEPQQKRAAFANDLGNLTVLVIRENQRKSDYGPADYSPSNASYLGPYLLQYAMVKNKWKLSVTQADFDAIAAGLSKHYPA